MTDDKKVEDKKPEEKKVEDKDKAAEKVEEKAKPVEEKAKPVDAKPVEEKPAKDEPKKPAFLQNRPGEPEFPSYLTLSPDKLAFKSDKIKEEPVVVQLNLENTSQKRQTFKLKTTSNDVFRVRPPLGFVEPNSTQTIKVTYSSKELPTSFHFFALYVMSVPAESGKLLARQLWTPTTKPEGVKRLACSFEKADGTPWPVEKK